MQKPLKQKRRPVERLGDILLRARVVDEAQIERALERQTVQPGRIGTQLVSLGAVTEDDVARALSEQHRVPAFLSPSHPVNSAAVERLPRDIAARLRAVPVAWDAERAILHVTMADPSNLSAVDEIRFASNARRVIIQVAPDVVIDRLFARHYDGREPEPVLTPEVTLAPEISVPAARPAGAERGAILLADPNPKRLRALSALLESSEFKVVRAKTLEEAGKLMGKRDWTGVWLHQDWAGALAGPGTTVYGDPTAELKDHIQWSPLLATEVSALAEEAARRALGPEFFRAKQAVSLVRFLAGRSGVQGKAADCLALRAWRSALAGWELPADEEPLRGDGILRAVALYQQALLAGAEPAGAAEAVRSDPDLDTAAVTSLLRWAVGADLLRRMESSRRLLVLFPEGVMPDDLLEHLEQTGWELGFDPDREDDKWDAVLAALEPGLVFLEEVSNRPESDRPPVFVVTQAASDPDTMYALRLGAEDVFAPDTHPDVVETKLDRATARRRREPGLVSGSLRDMSLSDILQILSNGLKTAVIRITAPHSQGEIALLEGQVADARAGDLAGEDALYEMLGWEDGTFRIEPDVRTRSVTIRGSTEGLLMEGFRRLDEARRDDSEQIPELG